MIAELLLVMAGHSSSLFPEDHKIHPAFAPLLHPGERQCLESLSLIALRYRKIKEASHRLSRSPSRYVCALCATLNHILKAEYENLVVEVESKVLRRDANVVAGGSFVPLSSVRAAFAEWDAPMAALASLVEELETEPKWVPGPLVDMLVARSRTGVYKISDILSRLSIAVQLVWRTQLIAFLVHGSLAAVDPLAGADYTFLPGSIPSCISPQSRESISYVGRAISTVKAAKWQKQLPRSLASEHTVALEQVLPQDQHDFDLVVSRIRTNVSEWLWMNVLTPKDVEDAVDSLANYFLLRNGEFSLSLIREIERLKLSRLTTHTGPSTSMIREQDLNLALLRASLGTSAQHDPCLTRLKISLPLGPLRPLLATAPIQPAPSGTGLDPHLFNTHLLGTPLVLSYAVAWPLDLFLHSIDLNAYSTLFSYLSALRKTHTRIHGCWTSLSNAQRARRRWTGLGEGGTSEDLELRRKLLRCGWGIVRDMNWFLDTLLGYVMMDVVDVEYQGLRGLLGKGTGASSKQEVVTAATSSQSVPTHTARVQSSGLVPSGSNTSNASTTQHLDFTSLRAIHATYLDRLLTGCLLTNTGLTSTLRSLLEVCERFAAQVERWGGDILPPLLSEGSLKGFDEEVGGMVRQRWSVVAEINESLHQQLAAFYEQLSVSTSQQAFTASTDASKSIMLNASMANVTVYAIQKSAKGPDGGVTDVRRHVERLLLRLDFNGEFSSRVGRAQQRGTRILGESR